MMFLYHPACFPHILHLNIYQSYTSTLAHHINLIKQFERLHLTKSIASIYTYAIYQAATAMAPVGIFFPSKVGTTSCSVIPLVPDSAGAVRSSGMALVTFSTASSKVKPLNYMISRDPL